jgi:hypothetical protein
MAFRRAEDGRDVALSTAAEIARALGVSLDWLAGLTDVNEPTETRGTDDRRDDA